MSVEIVGRIGWWTDFVVIDSALPLGLALKEIRSAKAQWVVIRRHNGLYLYAFQPEELMQWPPLCKAISDGTADMFTPLENVLDFHEDYSSTKTDSRASPPPLDLDWQKNPRAASVGRYVEIGLNGEVTAVGSMQLSAPPRNLCTVKEAPTLLDAAFSVEDEAPQMAGREPTAPFVAHPRLTPEAPARAGRLLPFTAGFAERPDPDADEQRRIRIEDAQPGETLLVVVSAEGASIEGDGFAELQLDLTDEHRFIAKVGNDVARVVLRAQYLFRNKLVGCIVKTLAVGGAEAVLPLPPVPDTEPDATKLPLADPGEVDPADIVLWVQNELPGFVTWTAYVGATGRKFSPDKPCRIGDSQHFAKALAGLRSTYGDSGNGARDELAGIGRDIAALIPKAIIDEVLTPAFAAGKPPPSILLMTDEPFVPWELARLSAAQAGRDKHDKPAFLGALARIGRWWTGEASSGAPSQTRIEHISAVAASQYGLASNLQTLQYAIAERSDLQAGYQAEPVEARRADVDAWLDREPRVPGHLAHIALHGYSDALADVQGLVLGDGAVLTPKRLAGEWDEGQAPRFAVVFLNACQVGTGGERLGRIAGFPGALIKGGASAFIAPLWEVQDEVARDFSRDFYAKTLGDGLEVGEALRAIRAETKAGGSITPWAYLYYGHPRLRLIR